MNFQDASNLRIPEGYVRTIHDKNSRLLWGSVGYNVSFDGNATQTGTPTPDSPQPISVVTGKNTVKVVGKNLLSGDYSQFDNQGGTGTLYAYFKLPTEERYTLTLKAKSAIRTQSPAKYIGLTSSGGGGGNILWAYIGQAAEAGQVFSIPNIQGSTVLYFCSIYPKNAETLQWFMDNFDIQLELGTTATAYEAYTAQDYEVNLGKNLFDATIYDGLASNADGTVKTAKYYVDSTPVTLNLKPNTSYTLSVRDSSMTLGSQFITATINGGSALNLSSGLYSFTTDSTGAIVLKIGATGFGNIGQLNYYIQLELGSQVSDYAPYFTPLELAKIGTYQDRIYKDGEKWYIEKQVGKITYNGSEASWQIYQYAVGGYQFYKAMIVHHELNIVTTKSDYFVGGTVINRGNTQNTVYTYNGGLAFNPAGITTLDDWKDWLSTHNTTVYYALATPTTTEITNQSLIDQLEAVYDWVRRHGYNASVTGDLPIIINRTALPTV